ncbi:MAG TPA: C45 family peptidase [Nocardioides sp.]|nr:C45 family peptidase [Nocardioides sp.]
MKLHELTTSTTDPAARGREIGHRYADQVRATTRGYLAHFAALGIDEAQVRATAASSTEALRAWWPAMAEETAGIAEGAGVEPWQVEAVAARTEVLVAAPGPGECTTAVLVPPGGGAPETIQTWDWHDGLCLEGLLLDLTTATGRRVKLFTELGTAAKIGVNDAGVGLHFNILRHHSDHVAGGVPVHAIARRVLEEAASVAEAVEIARSATVSASTVLTVASYAGGVGEAASIEMSPAGTAVVRPAADGWLIHTNHFLDPVLAEGEAGTPESLSEERHDHVVDLRTAMAGRRAADRAAAFCGPAGSDAPICMRPDTALPDHEQWGTLLTICLDLPGFALDHRPDSPDVAARDGLARF